jgi:membrane protein DedA with SNARE-associated domain
MGVYLATHGYWAITVLMILTGSGLPVPEEVLIVTAGVLSAPENLTLDWRLALPCCLFGAVVGDIIMYWIGYHFGRNVLCEHPWWARWVTPEREAQIEERFRRDGFKVFFVARFLVGLRTPVYLTAGILRVSFRRFVLIDMICATAVVGTFFGLAYWFGQPIAVWINKGRWVLTAAVLVAAACVVVYWWQRRKKSKSQQK